MKILNPKTDLDKFLKKLAKSSEKALLLDYDGTIAPFHVDHSKAYPYPGVPVMLDNIMQDSDTRLVIITGRWIKDLPPLLRLHGRPEIWGSHGIERLKTDGSYEISPMDEDALDGLVRADEWVEQAGLSERSEEKPGCLAIHWRGLDDEKMEGHGLGVLVRETLRPTAADVWIKPPDELLNFLSLWLLERQRGHHFTQ